MLVMAVLQYIKAVTFSRPYFQMLHCVGLITEPLLWAAPPSPNLSVCCPVAARPPGERHSLYIHSKEGCRCSLWAFGIVYFQNCCRCFCDIIQHHQVCSVRRVIEQEASVCPPIIADLFLQAHQGAWNKGWYLGRGVLHNFPDHLVVYSVTINPAVHMQKGWSCSWWALSLPASAWGRNSCITSLTALCLSVCNVSLKRC
jgi:hypothetical protein